MKDYEVKVLDENDHIFIETLRNLGMSRNVATTMAYLMNVDEASSREIEITNVCDIFYSIPPRIYCAFQSLLPLTPFPFSVVFFLNTFDAPSFQLISLFSHPLKSAFGPPNRVIPSPHLFSWCYWF